MHGVLSKTTPSIKYEKFGSFYHLKESNLSDTKIEYIATEKVHGSNFTLTLTPDGVYAGKKEKWVNFDSDGNITNFQFPFELEVKKIENPLQKMRAELGSTKLIIYMEIYGNFLNRKNKAIYDELSDEQKACVTRLFSRGQQEIHYTNVLGMNLIAFAAKDDNGFIPFFKLKDLCEKWDIPIVPIIYRGTLRNIWNQPTEFKSKVSNLNEYAEGVVVIDPNNPGKRFKRVSEKFRLRHKQPKTAKAKAKAKTKVKTKTEPDEEEKKLLQECIENINHYIFDDSTALNKILGSHGGSVSKDKFIAFKLIEDVIKDYLNDNFDDICHIRVLEKKIRRTLLSRNFKDLVCEYVKQERTKLAFS